MAPSSGAPFAGARRLVYRKHGKYKDVMSWLAKTDIKNVVTEHNIDREHQLWSSEPDLWLYKPGCDPKVLLGLDIKEQKRRRSVDSRSSISQSHSATPIM